MDNIEKRYDIKSEKTISEIILKNGWADRIYWDRNDWYIEWSVKGKNILNRIPNILNQIDELNDSDKNCINFMVNYFGINKIKKDFDEITLNMQEEIIKIIQKRLIMKIPDKILDSIRKNGRSYIALEMILDTVKSEPLKELKKYIKSL